MKEQDSVDVRTTDTDKVVLVEGDGTINKKTIKKSFESVIKEIITSGFEKTIEKATKEAVEKEIKPLFQKVNKLRLEFDNLCDSFDSLKAIEESHETLQKSILERVDSVQKGVNLFREMHSETMKEMRIVLKKK